MCVLWKKNDITITKISIPSIITLQKPHLFKASMIELLTVIRVPPLDFVDTFDRNINNEFDEINVISLSDLGDITFSHYMTRPKSLIQRKLEKKFL